MTSSDSAPQAAKDETKALQIGHLGEEPTEIICPACGTIGETDLRKEVVTLTQNLVALWDCCCRCKPLSWTGKHDYNHYCRKCGCYIGRCIKLSFYKQKMFQMKRKEIEFVYALNDSPPMRPVTPDVVAPEAAKGTDL